MVARAGERARGPDFLCIGAQKGGTQWLYDQLVPHPGFWTLPIKELHHFDRPGSRIPKARRLYFKALQDLEGLNVSLVAHNKAPLQSRDVDFLRDFVNLGDQVHIEGYAKLFNQRGDQLCGDITPAYSGLDERPVEEIAARFPDLKVVYIARNPVDRFWSSFNMRRRRKKVRRMPTAKDVRAFSKRDGVIRRSYPSVTVSRWRKVIPPERFGLFFFDDLAADAAAVRTRVLEFLGASSDLGEGIAASYNRKEKQRKVSMDAKTRALVASIYAKELEACAEVLGGPAVDWARKDLP